MSAINRLPAEIVGTIFLHVLPPFDALKNPKCVPIVLSRVCRLWRTLVLALPSIWASLNITCDHRILHPPLHVIRTHLLRSAGHPLSIVLSISDQRSVSLSSNPQFSDVLAALAVARTRWRFISVTLLSGATQEIIDAIAQGDAPLLQSFSCHIGGYAVSSVSLRAPRGCPRLESLAWRFLGARLSLGPADGPWPHLTTLDLHMVLTVPNCLTLLQLSPRLSTAKFQKIDSNSPSDTPSPHHLRHATLHTLYATGSNIAALLSALTLPALVELRLSIPPPYSVGNHLALPDLLARSAPPLRRLTLINMRLPEAALLRALAFAGNLNALIIAHLGRTHVSLTALISALHPRPQQGQSPLCPHLSTLVIDALDVPDGVCTAMLRARWGAEAHINGVAELRTVYIALEGDEHERDDAEMRKLNAEGMIGTLSRAI